MMDSPLSVRFLVIHCSATRADRNYTDKQLMRDHKKRGFRTVGYHFYVHKDGSITQFRKLLEVGSHARPYNRCSIGICYEGGLDDEGRPADTLTRAQYDAMWNLLRKLKITFPQAKIVGHRDLPGTTPKACPCFDAAKKFPL
ncbi:MAG: N-acetylmuramoyl-L-alanine amidase [Prevotella sp.]|jgi:N-acetylmuramoyl-L-alanine amidase|nr:N-acetylmuramoyl-L-alanine amidase [Prevotella sp.]MQO98008.1 N-acetylmuramoyl-L-alanine amidase [Segatella copri]